jgi:hypothetical protein
MSSLRTKFFKRHPSERPVGVRIRDLPSNLKTPNFAPFSRSRGDGSCPFPLEGGEETLGLPRAVGALNDAGKGKT